MKMKILYCQSEKITLSTRVKKAFLEKEDFYKISDKKNGDIIFSELRCVEFCKWEGLGSYIKLVNGNDTYFLTIPRLFINIGGGFAIINSFAVKKLYNEMKQYHSDNN